MANVADVLLPILGAVAGAASPAAARGILLTQKLMGDNRERKREEWLDKERRLSISDVMGGNIDAGLSRLGRSDPKSALATVLSRGRAREEDTIEKGKLDSQISQAMEVMTTFPPEVQARLKASLQSNPALGMRLIAQYAAGPNAARQASPLELFNAATSWGRLDENPAEGYRAAAGGAPVDPSIIEALNRPEGTRATQIKQARADIAGQNADTSVRNAEIRAAQVALQAAREARLAAAAGTPEGVLKVQKATDAWQTRLDKAIEDEAEIRQMAEDAGLTIVVPEGGGDGSFYVSAGADATDEQRRLLRRLTERKKVNADTIRRAREQLSAMQGGDDLGDWQSSVPVISEDELLGQQAFAEDF